jgi:hypothetical protein
MFSFSKKKKEDVIETFIAPSPDPGNLVIAGAVTASGVSNAAAITAQTASEKASWAQDKITQLKEFVAKYSQSAMQFANMVKMTAQFFPIIIVFSMIIAFFTKPLEFIMLGVALVFLSVFYVLYFILSIPPFIYIPFLVWFIIMDIIPFVVYTIVLGALFLVITLFCLILGGLNTMLGGALKNLLLCQNAPDAWFKTPNFHLSNKYERGFFCSRQCFKGYYPDETGLYCAKTPISQPSYCPQAEVMRLLNGQRSDIKYAYADYPIKGNFKYLMKSPEEREVLIKNHFLKKREFLEKCEKKMEPYKAMPLNVCSSLDTIEKTGFNNVDKKTMQKMKQVCFQAFCNSKSNYPFCAKLNGAVVDDSGEYWKKIIKIAIMIIVFVFIILFTLGYLGGVVSR